MPTDNKTTATQPNKFVKPGRVQTVKGSILTPHYAGLRFVLNVANMAGKVDDPIYKVFNKKWPKIKQDVRGWWATKTGIGTGAYKIGSIRDLAVQSDCWCISMLCRNENLELDLAGLQKCLKEVCKMARYEKATCHISTILTNEIPELVDLLKQELVDQGVSVSFYEEP